eukprot:3933770-Rhodomonas_salina.2
MPATRVNLNHCPRVLNTPSVRSECAGEQTCSALRWTGGYRGGARGEGKGEGGGRDCLLYTSPSPRDRG